MHSRAIVKKMFTWPIFQRACLLLSKSFTSSYLLHLHISLWELTELNKLPFMYLTSSFSCTLLPSKFSYTCSICSRVFRWRKCREAIVCLCVKTNAFNYMTFFWFLYVVLLSWFFQALKIFLLDQSLSFPYCSNAKSCNWFGFSAFFNLIFASIIGWILSKKLPKQFATCRSIYNQNFLIFFLTSESFHPDLSENVSVDFTRCPNTLLPSLPSALHPSMS